MKSLSIQKLIGIFDGGQMAIIIRDPRLAEGR